MFDEKCSFIQTKMTKCCQKVSKLYTSFENYMKCKENVYLEDMNINCQPAATRLITDIKHQPELYLVDV